MKHLVIGCGYLGRRVAALWREGGADVVATTRSSVRADALRDVGWEPIIGDITKRESLGELPDVDTVLFAVGFDRQVGDTIEAVYVDGLRNTLAALGTVRRFIYISTTGVYSQDGGEWVDESSATEPHRAGGKACLRAEQLLRESDIADRVTALRLAGIYGPDRIPNQKPLLAGEPITSPSRGYLNLIHVDDAARIVVRAAKELVAPDLLLVSDGNPVLRSDYYRTAAKLIGAPEPTFASPEPDTPAAARAATDKRISNQRLRDTLDYDFLYPTHKEGLAQAIEHSSSG